MKIVLPPPIETPIPPQSFFKDFILLLKNQMRVFWNKQRHRPKRVLFLYAFLLFILAGVISSFGYFIYGTLENISPDAFSGLLALIFMGGLVSQIFFGITAAFAALYMSEDLELLFMAPVSLKAVFAVKSLSVISSNLVVALFFVFLPGLFLGLTFEAGLPFYLLVVLVTFGILVIGTALAELLNLVVMRLVPPHRSKEAVGFIGGIAGILIALLFQIPNFLMGREGQMDLSAWLMGNQELLAIMKFFPWGWGSQALAAGITGKWLVGLAWSMLTILAGVILFALAFSLLERGFRRGFISLSHGEGGRRRTKKKRKGTPEKVSPQDLSAPGSLKNIISALNPETTQKASYFETVWAIAKKDLLYLKRDTREWFGYLTPLIIMAFFIAQYLFSSFEGAIASLVTVFVMYTIMFSGNMALQAFGREGESEWLLNSVPATGWPVVWGKLLASVLPTLILMEAMLVGTGIAIGLSKTMLVAFAIGAIFLSLGSSAIGLFYSVNNSRYNPDSPQARISPGASIIMYLINMIFILLLAIGVAYLFAPDEMVEMIRMIPPVSYEGGILSALIYGLYLLTRPLLWSLWARILTGLVVTIGIWSGIFFGFMSATVRQSRKGLRVEIVTGGKKKKQKKKKLKEK